MYEQSSHFCFAFDTYESVRNHAPVESGNLPLPVAFFAWSSTASLRSCCCVRSASLWARVLCVASRMVSHERGMRCCLFGGKGVLPGQGGGISSLAG